MGLRSSVRRSSTVSLFVFVAATSLPLLLQAADQDQFEGAVWRFKMTQKKSDNTTLIGRYRISDHTVYQKDTPADPSFSKAVGKNHPNGTKTRMEVVDFRAFQQSNKKQQRIEGTARLKMVEFGKWTGMFTDKVGVNWDFECSRIQE